MASAHDSSSIFPEPIPITCETIHATNINYKLEFIKGEFRYIVRLPTPIDRTRLDKITSLLTLNEIDGSEDGIYTWVLIDFGESTPKQILVKQCINITEIGTKHSDILKDICLNKQHIGAIPLPPDSIIRVYVAGELFKRTDKKIPGKNDHITYGINLLSGSYSDGQIDPVNFSSAFEEELKEIFITGICGNDRECISKHTIEILRIQDTIITAKHTPVERFDSDMIDTYVHSGAKVYKFGPRDRNAYNRAGVMAEAMYNSQMGIFSRTFKPTDENYQSRHDEIESKYKPLTNEELRPFLLYKGGKKRKSKSRKTKKNKRTKYAKKSRKYILKN